MMNNMARVLEFDKIKYSRRQSHFFTTSNFPEPFSACCFADKRVSSLYGFVHFSVAIYDVVALSKGDFIKV